MDRSPPRQAPAAPGRPTRRATRPLRVVALFALSGCLALSRFAIAPALPALPGWLALPGLAALPALAGGCSQVAHVAQVSRDPVRPAPAPEVERDFDRIRAYGVLRMVTRPQSPGYFLHKGGDAGFEYELLRDFARSWNLRLEVVVATSGNDLVSVLNRGEADVAAADLDVDPFAARFASFTRPCNVVRDVLVLPAGASRADLGILDGLDVHVHEGTAAWREVVALRDDLGYACRPVPADTALAVEGLVAAVARGELPATIAPLRLARAVLLKLPGGRIGPTVHDERPIAWMVRRNSPDLLSALDHFLQGHFQITESGSRRSAVWGSLYQRYFADPGQVRRYLATEHRPDLGGSISPWDRLLQAAADSAGFDWRLVAAVAYEESRFDPRAVSPAGAIGLMQMRPRADTPTAERLLDPELNVRAGVRYLRQIWEGYAELDSLDRWQLTLATYHAGAGNISRARRRAEAAGLDPDRWEDGVALALLLLAQERREAGGPPFHGTTTIAYVEDVIGRHRLYSSLAPADPFVLPDQPAVLAAAPAPGPWARAAGAGGAGGGAALARLAP